MENKETIQVREVKEVTEESTKKIVVKNKGSYKFYGGIKLKEMTVEKSGKFFMFSDEKVHSDQDYYGLCRCGETKKRPFCDGTHRDIPYDYQITAPLANAVTKDVYDLEKDENTDEEAVVLRDKKTGKLSGIIVRGNIQIESEEGKPYERRKMVVLCNCGHSKNKPYCDGTHENIE